MGTESSIVGDLINFRGLVYAPLNENGVIYLFGKVTNDLHMYVEEIKPGYPDCIARRFTGRGWERIRVEFEHRSSNFKQHGHDPEDCDVVVCWAHDWKECPLEVIELKTAIQDMVNETIQRPGTSREAADFDKTMAALFDRAGTQEAVRDWWERIEAGLIAEDADIWFNIGEKYAGVYIPERSFASLNPRKTALVIDCFTRGEPLAGAKVSNKKHSPRWGRFTVKGEQHVEKAVEILLEARARLKEALRAGEATGYFSGGEGYGKKEGGEDQSAGDDDSD